MNRYHDSKWVFPAHTGTPIYVCCDFIYNFVLDKHHIISVNGVDVITLGHGFDDPALVHPFFGTNAVIDHLKTHPGWDNGLIELHEYNPKYKDGMISSFW